MRCASPLLCSLSVFTCTGLQFHSPILHNQDHDKWSCLQHVKWDTDQGTDDHGEHAELPFLAWFAVRHSRQWWFPGFRWFHFHPSTFLSHSENSPVRRQPSSNNTSRTWLSTDTSCLIWDASQYSGWYQPKWCHCRMTSWHYDCAFLRAQNNDF